MIGCNVGRFGDEVGKSAIVVGGDADWWNSRYDGLQTLSFLITVMKIT